MQIPQKNNSGFLGEILNNVQEVAGTAGSLIEQFIDNQEFGELAKKLHIEPFLFALDQVNVKGAQQHVQHLITKHPNWTLDEIANRLIQEKAILLGAQGFASSIVPGFAAGLLAVDMATSLAAQAELIFQIASVYSMDLNDGARKAEALTVFSLALGGKELAKVGLSFTRNIPIAGSLIGAGGNAALTYAVGLAANEYYKAIYTGKSQEEAQKASKKSTKIAQEESSEQESALDGIFAHMLMAGNQNLTLEDIVTNLDQLPLEEISKINIHKHLQTLKDFDTLLNELKPEYGLVALAQAERLARADAHITEQEQKILDKLENKFQKQAEQLDSMLPCNYILSRDFKHTVRGLNFSQDGQYLCACSDDRSIKIWKTYDQCSSFQLLHNLKNTHNDEIKGLAMSRDDEILATGSKDRIIKLWDYRNGKLIQQFDSGHKRRICSLAFGDNRLLASSSDDEEIKIWNVSNGAIRRSLFGHRKAVYSLAFDPAGKILASGSDDRTVKLWNPQSGEIIHEFSGHKHGIFSVGFSPDGQTLAAGTWDGKIHLWDIETSTCLTVLEGHTAEVLQVLFTHNGEHLISSANDKSIAVWDITGQMRIRLDGHRDGVFSLALSSIHPVVASGSWDNTVRIWRVDLND